MNCAAVTITEPGSKGSTGSNPAPSSASSYASTPTAAPSTPNSVGNAASSYDMDGCSCTCADPAKLDHDSQYTMGGCTCTCSKSPPPMEPGAINKRFVAHRIGRYDCTCASQTNLEQETGYVLDQCSCVGVEMPKTAHRSSTDDMASSVNSMFAQFRSLVQGFSRRVLTLHDYESVQREKRSVAAFNERPSMFFGDTDDGCESPLTSAELKYPNPGPDVVPGDGVYPLALPQGEC